MKIKDIVTFVPKSITPQKGVTYNLYSLPAENGGYPPTQNGEIRSLIQLFRRKELQNGFFSRIPNRYHSIYSPSSYSSSKCFTHGS